MGLNMTEHNDVELTSWKTGDDGTYGFRIKLETRDLLYPESNPLYRSLADDHTVVFWLPQHDGPPLMLTSQITDSFWDDCPEFRFIDNMGKDFKTWMQNNGGGLTWPGERPHKYKAKVRVDINGRMTAIEVRTE